MKRYLTSKSTGKRFFSLLGICFVSCTLFWFISYYFFPLQMLRSKFPTTFLFGEDLWLRSIVFESLKIFVVNILIVILVIVLPSYFRISNLSLGYAMPMIQICIYGIFLGTNSFTIPYQIEKIKPTISIFLGSGPYEFIAFILIASVCYSLGYYNAVGKWPKKTKLIKLRNNRLISFTKKEILLIIIAIIILLGANFYEAYRIFKII